MTTVDYTRLFDPPLACLGIDFGFPGDALPWEIRDRNDFDSLYSRAATLDHAVAFVRATVRHGDAVADEASIEYHRVLRVQAAHSVRVDAEAIWARAQEATSHDRLANVYRIRPHEQIDEAS